MHMSGMAAFTPAAPARKVDGRNSRIIATKAAILAATRELMQEGRFQPSVVAIAARARKSKRSAFKHFNTMDALYTEALKDPTTRAAILMAVVGEGAIEVPIAERIVRAVVLGRAEA